MMRAAWLAACGLAVTLAAVPRLDAGRPVVPPPGPPDFAEAIAAAGELPRLFSLLASVRGEVVLERYFNGARAARSANVKSVSKSLISALVGAAIDAKLIAGVDTPIASYFPELAKDRDTRKRAITVEDLLTMRSGLESTSNRNYGAWVLSANWVRHALSRALVSPPGERMQYSTGNSHLLSAILTKASQASTWQYAQQTLARPLGFTLERWPQDPQGIYFGGNDMLLTPRQMLAFGELYLNRGRANGQQVVPAAWVDRSFIPRGYSPISGHGYGYGWWTRELAGHAAYFAWGFGGQYIVLVPSLDLVVVTTSASTVAEDRRSHRRTLFELLEDLVIAPVAASQARTYVGSGFPGLSGVEGSRTFRSVGSGFPGLSGVEGSRTGPVDRMALRGA